MDKSILNDLSIAIHPLSLGITLCYKSSFKGLYLTSLISFPLVDPFATNRFYTIWLIYKFPDWIEVHWLHFKIHGFDPLICILIIHCLFIGQWILNAIIGYDDLCFCQTQVRSDWVITLPLRRGILNSWEECDWLEVQAPSTTLVEGPAWSTTLVVLSVASLDVVVESCIP